MNVTLSSNCIMQLAQIYRPKKQKSEPDSPDFVSDCTRRNRFVWPDSLDLSRSLVCMNPRKDRKQTKNLQLRIQRISQTLFELNYIIYENCSMYTFLLHLSGIYLWIKCCNEALSIKAFKTSSASFRNSGANFERNLCKSY